VPRATAVVATDAPARYAKQLLAHLGRKREVQPLDGVPDGGTLVFDDGVGHVRPGGAALVLEAVADDADALARVQDVLGRHLERFGARRELSVRWRPAGDGIGVVHTDEAPVHAGPVPQAVTAGDWVFVSALFGVDPATRAIPPDAEAEADQLLTNLEAVLAAAGAALTDVVRAGIAMRALQRDRPAFNRVWEARFGAHRPARSAVEVADFGRPGENARYMVEATAFRG
jgi:enamine deaminase RidA (YjgF/YER057c/UK114 family)